MGFWDLPNGKKVTGLASDAFLRDFVNIPDGTTALAMIKHFVLVTKEANQYSAEQKFYEITWKIISDNYKNREVSQKLKVFDGKPEAIERNLNMMKLIMNLCQFEPMHSDAPSDQELARMQGKICGIKIREWSVPKQDGSGMMTGNNVSEVHASTGFECIEGEKLEVTGRPESALNRNPAGMMPNFDDNLPF